MNRRLRAFEPAWRRGLSHHQRRTGHRHILARGRRGTLPLPAAHHPHPAAQGWLGRRSV